MPSNVSILICYEWKIIWYILVIVNYFIIIVLYFVMIQDGKTAGYDA